MANLWGAMEFGIYRSSRMLRRFCVVESEHEILTNIGTKESRERIRLL